MASCDERKQVESWTSFFSWDEFIESHEEMIIYHENQRSERKRERKMKDNIHLHLWKMKMKLRLSEKTVDVQ